MYRSRPCNRVEAVMAFHASDGPSTTATLTMDVEPHAFCEAIKTHILACPSPQKRKAIVFALRNMVRDELWQVCVADSSLPSSLPPPLPLLTSQTTTMTSTRSVTMATTQPAFATTTGPATMNTKPASVQSEPETPPRKKRRIGLPNKKKALKAGFDHLSEPEPMR